MSLASTSNADLSLIENNSPDFQKTYADYVNPQWVKLLSILDMNKNFVSAQGAELTTDDGKVYLDFLAGYGVYNIGHNHPYLAQELIRELQSLRPSMLQSHVPGLAAQLAERLCKISGGKLEKVYFGSSGSEGVETSIKFSRAFTKRGWILFAEGAFHGLTCGALSLMSNPWWREQFGNLLEETKGIPFGNLEALKKELATEKYAALILEPVQGESGVSVPSIEYLQEAQCLCEKHGTLLVIDEVQTGLHRTGEFIASHHFEIEPDILILAKALSGGHVPVGAVLMREDVYHSVYKSVDKAFVHASTFSENALAMRAGLATLDVLENENLGEQSRAKGEFLRQALRNSLERFEFVKEIRGLGLMNGIVFKPPTSMSLKVLFSAFRHAHAGLFGQMIVRALFGEHQILSQMAGNDHMVIKVMPPLVVTEEQLLAYVSAIEQVCETIKNDKTKFWSQGATIAAKAFSLKG